MALNAAPAPPAPPAPQQARSFSLFGASSAVSENARRPGLVACRPPPRPIEKRKVRKANTNVLAIDLSTLASNAELIPGDPYICKSCTAVFSSHSKSEDNGSWICEFCNTTNDIQIDDEEKPKSETVEFLVEPAPATSGDASAPVIIFCVDISGSMCSSTEVPGNFKLKGQRNNNNLLEAGDDRRQYFPGANRNVTYVSRLQCVQAAIESQLESMATNTPQARVALVTFNRDVTIYGDCLSTSVPTVVSGAKLDSYDQLLEIGEQHKNMKPISETKAKLIEKLMKLEEDGSTALGPAVAVCLGMARGSLGARIVLATDGLSNTGVGAMDVEALMHEAQEYYEKLAVVSMGQSTTINIVGIRGGDSVRMTMLGKMADATQGEVNLVDPLNIVSEFASMLNSSIVATNVSVKLLLHKGLSLVKVDASKLIPGAPRSESAMDVSAESSAEQSVGNAYDDSELTFEYEVGNSAKLKELFDERARILSLPGELPEEFKTLPFQVQITFTKLDGSKCLRTITRTQAITHNRTLVEQSADTGMLGAHAWAQSARLAEQGHYEAAILNNMQMNSVLSRAPQANSAQFEQYSRGTEDFNRHMRVGRKKAAVQIQQNEMAGAPAPSAASASALDDDDEASTRVLQFKSNRKAKKGLW